MTTIRRTGLGLLLLAVGLMAQAQTVYVVEHGKVFHARKTCSYLKSSKDIYTTSRATAEQAGLKPCHICYGKIAHKGWKEAGR